MYEGVGRELLGQSEPHMLRAAQKAFCASLNRHFPLQLLVSPVSGGKASMATRAAAAAAAEQQHETRRIIRGVVFGECQIL